MEIYNIFLSSFVIVELAILIILIAFIFLQFIIRPFRRYWQENWWGIKPSCKAGCVLDLVRLVLWAVRKIFPLEWIKYYLKTRSPTKWAYIAVDLYVVVWFLFGLLAFIWLVHIWGQNVLAIIIGYRLLDIFQTWFGNFVIGAPILRSPQRTLVLTLLGYGEVVLWYSTLALLNWNHFQQPIICWQQALYYAMTTATIGGDIRPI